MWEAFSGAPRTSGQWWRKEEVSSRNWEAEPGPPVLVCSGQFSGRTAPPTTTKYH